MRILKIILLGLLVSCAQVQKNANFRFPSGGPEGEDSFSKLLTGILNEDTSFQKSVKDLNQFLESNELDSSLIKRFEDIYSSNLYFRFLTQKSKVYSSSKYSSLKSELKDLKLSSPSFSSMDEFVQADFLSKLSSNNYRAFEALFEALNHEEVYEKAKFKLLNFLDNAKLEKVYEFQILGDILTNSKFPTKILWSFKDALKGSTGKTLTNFSTLVNILPDDGYLENTSLLKWSPERQTLELSSFDEGFKELSKFDGEISSSEGKAILDNLFGLDNKKLRFPLADWPSGSVNKVEFIIGDTQSARGHDFIIENVKSGGPLGGFRSDLKIIIKESTYTNPAKILDLYNTLNQVFYNTIDDVGYEFDEIAALSKRAYAGDNNARFVLLQAYRASTDFLLEDFYLFHLVEESYGDDGLHPKLKEILSDNGKLNQYKKVFKKQFEKLNTILSESGYSTYKDGKGCGVHY